MGQTGHGWLTRMVNAMTTQPMPSADHELLLLAKRKRSEANGPRNLKGISYPAKARFTVTLPGALLDRLRNAVYWTTDLTLVGLIEQAVEDSLDRLEQQHGGPFPPRIDSLKGGRPRRVRSDLDRS